MVVLARRRICVRVPVPVRGRGSRRDGVLERAPAVRVLGRDQRKGQRRAQVRLRDDVRGEAHARDALRVVHDFLARVVRRGELRDFQPRPRPRGAPREPRRAQLDDGARGPLGLCLLCVRVGGRLLLFCLRGAPVGIAVAVAVYAAVAALRVIVAIAIAIAIGSRVFLDGALRVIRDRAKHAEVQVGVAKVATDDLLDRSELPVRERVRAGNDGQHVGTG